MKSLIQFFNNFSFLTLMVFSCSSFAIVSKEKSLMDQARTSYQNGNLDAALNTYQKIPQNSDYWVESLEERAWTHLRKGDNNQALSLITTLTSDLLAPQIGPEPYFLKGLIDYRLCNIKGIFQDFELFKKRYKDRGKEIEKLKSQNSNLGTKKALDVLKLKKTSLASLSADDFGPEIQYLPRLFYRDRTVKAAIGTGNDQRVLQRLGQLAEDENKEIEMVLQKMHLLESQVVQQVFAYNKEMHNKKEAQFSIKDKNSLVFPYKPNSDIWLDEIENFEAATTACPVDPLKGASL